MIVEGSADYPEGSAERLKARKKAAGYADRSETLGQIIRQKGLVKPKKPIGTAVSTPQAITQTQSNGINTHRGYQNGAQHVNFQDSSSKHENVSHSTNHTAQIRLNDSSPYYTAMDDDAQESSPSRCHWSFSTWTFRFTVAIIVVTCGTVGIVFGLNSSKHEPQPIAPPPSPSPSPSPSPPPAPPSTKCGAGPEFQLWNKMVDNSAWYDFLDVNVPKTHHSVSGVLSNGKEIELELDYDLGGTSKSSSQLYANPEFLKHYDDIIRDWNPEATNRTGQVDSCGFPLSKKDSNTADLTEPEKENTKRLSCFYDDFSQGLELKNFRPLLQKGCCKGPPNSAVGCWNFNNSADGYYPEGCNEAGSEAYKYNGNIGVESMEVEYPHGSPKVLKNVMRLTSFNKDNDLCTTPFPPNQCGDPNNCDEGTECHSCWMRAKKLMCHKKVESSGIVQTNDMFASGRYEVVAKVPGDRGLVWAIWTFHYEEHIPGELGCEDYTCYSDGFKGGALGQETRHASDPRSHFGKDFDKADAYSFEPKTLWKDCCNTDTCCLDHVFVEQNEGTNPFLRGGSDQCPIPKAKRLTNSTCKCCDYTLDHQKFPNHKYNAPCCVAGKETVGPCGTGKNICDKDYYSDKRTAQCSGGKDPQWLRNASMVSWLNRFNHEIDIEIPASCYDSVVCGGAPQKCSLSIEGGKWCNTTLRDQYSCAGDMNTMNANNYIMTTNGGTGHAYTNMCLKAFQKTDKLVETQPLETPIESDGIKIAENDELDASAGEQKPFMLVGDGKFHKYTIDWHTGGPDCEARVDFYVDDVLLATNNAMVPTRGSRLVIGAWAPNKASPTGWNDEFNAEWTNFPDHWGDGEPGDGLSYLSHVYVSEVKITPHNEPNDIMYPATYDRPDGCQVIHGQEQNGCHTHWETNDHLAWKDNRIPPKRNAKTPASMSCAK